jgi:hypothetical protein
MAYKGIWRKIAATKKQAAKRNKLKQSDFAERVEKRYQDTLKRIGFKSPSSSGLGRQRRRD